MSDYRNTRHYGSPLSDDPYLSAVDGASQRTRWALVTVTVASVLAFFALWNSMFWGWNKHRLDTARRARVLLLSSPADRDSLLNQETGKNFMAAAEWLMSSAFAHPLVLHQLETIPADSTDKRTRRFVELLPPPEYLVFAPHIGSASIDTVLEPPVDLPSVASALDSARAPIAYELRDHTLERLLVEELQSFIDGMVQERTRSIIDVDVPFLGVHFDINDLAWFAGLSLLILMVLLRLALSRELANLVVTFDRVMSNSNAVRWYTLLSMSQVLTVPRLLSSTALDGDSVPFAPSWAQRREGCFSAVRKYYPSSWTKRISGVLLVPACVETAIASYDVASMAVAHILNPVAAWFLTVVGAAFTLALWVIGLRCRRLFLDISLAWNCFHEAVELSPVSSSRLVDEEEIASDPTPPQGTADGPFLYDLYSRPASGVSLETRNARAADRDRPGSTTPSPS